MAPAACVDGVSATTATVPVTPRQRGILKAHRRLRLTATISVHDQAGRAAGRRYQFTLLAAR